ncbi:MAG TPA: DUF6655 family protein [Gemmataceae bacterium]|nr:DUF6655 family protein [Gemmataceae bacterium]
MGKSHRWEHRPKRRTWVVFLLIGLVAGCGTTRVSDTTRTATEQLLISHSIDETVSNLDFRMLAGKTVFLDPQYLDGVTDKGYLISSLRQHLLACGCLLQEDRKKATYVVEARAGSIGTDRNDLLFGVPQMTIPSVMPGIPSGMIPEIPLAKKTNRRAVAKIAVFAYNRDNGQPVWQSGVVQASSKERNSWLFGTGPFQRGTLIEGTEFDEQRIMVPLLDKRTKEPEYAVVGVTKPAYWQPRPLPNNNAATKPKQAVTAAAGEAKVIQASGSAPQVEIADKPE